MDRESETSSLNIDLGFPDEEDDHQPEGGLSISIFTYQRKYALLCDL